jgi:tRNA (guanine37-N1)-methyltransferase
MFHISFLTLTPEAFPGPLGVSILARAAAEHIWMHDTVDLRDFGIGPHHKVDDTPAGGGAGLVIRPDVAAAALDSLAPDHRPRIYLSPRGRPLTQAHVRRLAAGPGLVLLCGRFEGLDERVIEARGLEEVSIGDFVLAGGDVAAMALTEAVVRLLPGVAGNAASLTHESFESGLLEHPHYTLPRTWEDQPTPEVLLSGHHGQIAAWRLGRSKTLTKQRRPDLYAAYLETSPPPAPETGDEHH